MEKEDAIPVSKTNLKNAFAKVKLIKAHFFAKPDRSWNLTFVFQDRFHLSHIHLRLGQRDLEDAQPKRQHAGDDT